MAAMMMKMGMLKVLAFKVLALLVGKALLISKLAFLLATIIGLKKLFSQQKHVTYEVVAHPHHESHGSDSYSSAGWGRSSSEAAHNMAYSGQTHWFGTGRLVEILYIGQHDITLNGDGQKKK